MGENSHVELGCRITIMDPRVQLAWLEAGWLWSLFEAPPPILNQKVQGWYLDSVLIKTPTSDVGAYRIDSDPWHW